MPTEDPRPRALIVHAHPEPDSFCTAQMHAAAAALRDSGHRVDVVDLYALGFDPVLDITEFPAARRPLKPQAEQASAWAAGTLAPDVAPQLDLLLAADLLVLSFPVWWFALPAVLKGWVDRVFVSGGVFGGELGLFQDAAMHGRRAIVLATTGGSETSFTEGGRFGDLDRFLYPIHRGIFEFVGFEVLEPVVTFGPARDDANGRANALADVHSAFRAILDRPTAPAGAARPR
ncbi:NAD(P)H-dependent oxidoreductase [Amnibacterium setariae]|uniref:Flavodoxin family protein n=1 Tax=Amnibacterium setariae TaxID=2306585 RepID=A0A3A1TWP2_9MICO|nr:NAD(P)H-dependent oxidoreductase [Amnibacterium setariae]RIX28653.1 flavodoxin family protein [Amnibacterium setariae]